MGQTRLDIHDAVFAISLSVAIVIWILILYMTRG